MHSISDDVLLTILSFLPGRDLLKSLQFTSKSFHRVINNAYWLKFQFLNQNKHEKIFHEKTTNEVDWKKLLYISSTKSENFMKGNIPNQSSFGSQRISQFSTYLNFFKNIDENSDYLISGLNNGSINIWTQNYFSKESQWKLKKKLKPHFDEISSIEYENRLIITGSFDNTISIIDKDLNILHQLKGHNDWIRDVKYLKNYDQIVSCSRDTTIKIWEPTKGLCLNTLYGHQKTIWCLEHSMKNQNTLFSGSVDGYISIWDLRLKKLNNTNKCHQDIVTSIKCNDNINEVISSSYDKTIKLWDIRNFKDPIKQVKAHHTSICSMDYDQKMLITCSTDGNLKSWNDQLDFLQNHVPPYSAIHEEPLIIHRLCVCKLFNGGIFCNNDEANAVVHWRREFGIPSNIFQVENEKVINFFHVDSTKVIGSVLSNENTHLVEFSTEIE